VTGSDRWRHVEQIYHDALARDAHERAAFVRAACGGDEALCREVESLLTYADDAGGFLQTAAVEAVAATIGHTDKLAIGDRFGPYEITALLGSGGMGDVYRARDHTLGRDVALKMLPPVFTADADRRARFEREARVLAALNHPHIGAIYGLEDRDGVHALVLELVEGSTLADRLRAAPLPMRNALAIAAQIAAALEAAHDKGIVHRDLKPANIAITDAGLVKVLDFGLATTAVAAESDLDALPTVQPVTREGELLGTASYMSPEQARGQTVDKRTDVWAFGCVLFEMIAGRRPFSGASAADTIAAILHHEPAWADLPDETPPSIRRLLRRCLEKDRTARQRDIGDARLEIDEALQPREPDRTALPVDVASHRVRRAALIAGLSLLGAFLIAIPMARYMRGDPRDPYETRFDIQTPTTNDPASFAVSADGRQLAFVATVDGVPRLWVRSFDRTASRSFAGTERAMFPFCRGARPRRSLTGFNVAAGRASVHHVLPDSGWVTVYLRGRDDVARAIDLPHGLRQPLFERTLPRRNFSISSNNRSLCLACMADDSCAAQRGQDLSEMFGRGTGGL
jgi:serine/threonine protein kinase